MTQPAALPAEAGRMPDKRKHRGRHPADERLFSPGHFEALRSAVSDLSWLLSRGYADPSSLKLVGDRYDLTERQRLAVWRSACADESLARRRATEREQAGALGTDIGVDGYNLLITVEAGLSGGLIVVGRDGCFRDLAGIHGTYRKVEETAPALELISNHLAAMRPARVDFYLDRPVSNSGRLKALLAEILERQGRLTGEAVRWNIELLDSPDARLREYEGRVVTTDSVILDQCCGWMNLAKRIIQEDVPDAWIVDLRPD